MSGLGTLATTQPISIEDAMRQLTVAQQAIDYVASRGFMFPAAPQGSYRGMLPVNLIQLDDNALGNILTEIAGWLSFAEMELSKAKSMYVEAEEKLETITSRLRLTVKMSAEKKISNPEMDDVVNCDPRVIEAKRNRMFAQAVLEYTKNLVAGGQRDWETVSRRITQRGQEIDRNRRTDSVGQVPIASSAFRR